MNPREIFFDRFNKQNQYTQVFLENIWDFIIFSLKAKMSFSVKSFKELNHPVCYKEDAKLVFIKYKEMMALLSTFEDDVFKVV